MAKAKHGSQQSNNQRGGHQVRQGHTDPATERQRDNEGSQRNAQQNPQLQNPARKR